MSLEAFPASIAKPLPTVNPRPEHPRPDAVRSDWISLNGPWQFGFDPKNSGEQERWYRKGVRDDHFNLEITVPFPWESKLSGVCSPDYRGAGWYRRKVEIPLEWLARELHPILRFEAVDWNARVWINGRFACEHDGGYSPFELDLTPFLGTAGQAGAGLPDAGLTTSAGQGELPDAEWTARLELAPRITDRAAGELAVRAKSGDTAARDRLYKSGLLLVDAIASALARAVGSAGAPLSRLQEAGEAALERAVERFDPGRGRPFSALASRLVRHAVARAAIPDAAAGEETGGVNPGRSTLSVEVVIRAWDVCAADTPLGKQVLEWYTPSSGIWGSVWLEGRRASHVRRLHLSPDLTSSRAYASVLVDVDEPGEFELELRSPDEQFPAIRKTVTLPLGASVQGMEISIPLVRAWSPGDPHLYRVVAVLRREGEVRDSMETYFGMREVSRGTWGGSEHEYVLLNGEPIYLLGVLDQAFHPDGLHSYPSDDAIRADVEAARDAGFNLLRCHIKINDPRYYYWADRLGLLVMSDIPSPKLYTPRSREQWEATFRDAVERDYNHPCIIAWILFNETWGLEEHTTEPGWNWVRQMYQLCRGLDPTRLSEDNSACLYDHVATDLNSWHFYINDYDRARRHIQQVVARTLPGSPFNYVGGDYLQGTEPLINSEYGGIGARDGDRDIAHCLKYLTNELRRHDKVVGYVYTELSDIEWEHNGILNYDRTHKEFGYDAFVPGMSVASIHALDFLGIDAPPCQTVSPGARLAFLLFFSQFGRQELPGLEVRWIARFTDRFGASRLHRSGSHPIQPGRYHVVPAGLVSLDVPPETGLLTLAVEAVSVDQPEQVIAHHYVHVEVHDPDLAAEEPCPGGWAVRWNPGDFTLTGWDDPRVTRKGWKFVGQSSGAVEYEVLAPASLDPGRMTGLRLLLEAGASTASRRIGWSARQGRVNYPQTEVDRKYGSTLEVKLNGVTAGRVLLPDDPADARGVLSHHQEMDAGSYGFLVDLAIDGPVLESVIQRAAGKLFTVRLAVPVNAVPRGGLSLYGRRLGSLPLDPTLIFQVEP